MVIEHYLRHFRDLRDEDNHNFALPTLAGVWWTHHNEKLEHDMIDGLLNLYLY